MQRTLRSKKLRSLLYRAANGKCCICQRELGDDWHADHVIPFSVLGRTNVHEMQALCANCNLKKGSNMSDWGLESIEDVNHRRGHIEVIKKYQNWLRSGCPNRTFSVFMCCRYGKSDTIRNLAILSLQGRRACAALVVHPGTTLASQFLDTDRLIAWRRRWLPGGPSLKNVATLKDFAHKSMCNGEWLGSIHAQALAQSNQMQFAEEWVKKCIASYGVPPVVFFDESHQFSSDNSWGKIARKFHGLGCLVVVMTATPFRNDKDDVFGFKKRPVGEVKSKTIIYHQPAAEEGKLEKHTSKREEQEFLIEADCEIPFSQGWNEKCIAKCTFDLIDWNMEGWGEGREGDKRMLSEIPQEETRQILPSLYRDKSAIREAAARAIRHMKAFRQGAVKDATIVWYGMNDDAKRGVESENQKAIKDALLEEDSSLKVAIATQSQDKVADEKSDETILKFVDVKKKHYDALVLKQMGAAGLDSDRICVVVLWNTIRSLGQMIQMAMRGGNAGVKTHFVIVALADSMTSQKLKAFVDGEGGKYVDATETEHKIELVDKNDKQESGYVPVDVAEAGMSDSDGDVASYEDVKLALAVIQKMPYVISHDTIPKIAEAARALGMSGADVEEDVTFRDSTHEVEALAKNLKGYVEKIGRRRFRNLYGRPGTKEDNKTFGEFYRQAAIDIKARAGVGGSWDQKRKDRSLSRVDYLKWTQAADALYRECLNATTA